MTFKGQNCWWEKQRSYLC